MKTVDTEKLLQKVEQHEEKRKALIENALEQVEPLVTQEIKRLTPEIQDVITKKLIEEVDKELLADKAAIIDDCIIEAVEAVIEPITEAIEPDVDPLEE